MKIGIVIDCNLRIPGGVQEHARGLYDALAKLGQDVVLIACGEKGEEDGQRNVVSLGNLLELRFVGLAASVPFTWQTPGKIKAYLEKENFAVLHFEGPGGIFGLEVLALAKAASIATFHIYPGLFDISWLTLPIQPILRFFNRKFAGRIAVSPVAASYAQKFYPGKYEIIPNGVDISRFSAKGESLAQFEDGKTNLLFVGRLDPRKGILDLLKAYKMLTQKNDNLRLIIVGDGPQREKAAAFIKENQLKNIEFLGKVSAEELPSCYRTADIYCSPALYGESFGIVLIEAMASGLPVVAYANEGYALVLKDKPFCDFLVKPGDTASLAEKLEVLIKDKKLRQELGTAGLEEAKKYSWENVGKQTLEFYRTLVKP
ncbi:glycosyltransferase family 4 protein [Candidatus Shapirobacteria bacterium]|nr:glycosyltransferase family 4 protein [Candidatus Shapirobacteria bacterium]